MQFRSYDCSQLVGVAEKLKARTIASTFGTCFTKQDYLDLFVHPMLHEPMRLVTEAFYACDKTWFKLDIAGRVVNITISNGDLPAPRSPLLMNAPAETVQKLEGLVEQLGDINDGYASVEWALRYMADGRFSYGAVAFCIPGVKALAGMCEETCAERLLEAFSGRPSKIPPIDAELRHHCTLAAGWIATAQLIPEDISMAWDTFFNVTAGPKVNKVTA